MAQERPRITMIPIESLPQEVRGKFVDRYGVDLIPRNFRRAVKEMLFSMTEAAMMHSLLTRGEVPFQGRGALRRERLEGSDIDAEIRESRIGAVAYLHPDGKNPENHHYSFPLREPAVAFSGGRFQGLRYSEIIRALESGYTDPLREEFGKTVDLLSEISGNDLKFLKPYFLHYDPQELIIAAKYPARYARGEGNAPAVNMNKEQAQMLLDVLGIRSWKNFVQQYGDRFKTMLFEGVGIPLLELQEVAKNIGISINPDLLNDPNSIPGFIREHIGDDYEGYGFTFVSYYLLTALFPNLNQHARMAIAASVSNAYIAAVELGILQAPMPQTPDRLDITGGVFGSLIFVVTHYALTTYYNRKQQTQDQSQGPAQSPIDLIEEIEGE